MHVTGSIQQISKFTSSHAHTHTHTHTHTNAFRMKLLQPDTFNAPCVYDVATKYFSIQVMVILLYKVAASNADVQKYVMKFLLTELHVWFFAVFGDFL